MKFFDPLILQHVGGEKKFLLYKEVRCESEEGTVIYLPAGCSVNGFSFPQILRALPRFDPFGEHLLAAAQHDVLYETKDFSRKQTDIFFHESLLSLGEDPEWATIYYEAVRTFGEGDWDD